MKRESLSGSSYVSGRAATRRFPRGTLFISLGFLISGMRLADVLPVPAFPRFTSGAVATASASPRSDSFDAVTVPLHSDAPELGRGGRGLTLQDVSFNPVQVLLSPMSPRLQVRAHNGKIFVIDTHRETVVWEGSATEARFVLSNVSAAQTLTDVEGRVLWSEAPKPDLVFDKQPDGRARLTDKSGKTLWSGMIPPSSWTANSHSDRRGTALTIEFAGLRVSGINGDYTVRNDAGDSSEVLWSGKLPQQPLLLLREDHRFFYWDRDRPKSGRDRVTTIRLSDEMGRVTVRNHRSDVLGERPVRLLKVSSEVRLVGETGTRAVPTQYYVPRGNLARSGSALLTYRNPLGATVHSSSVVRDGDRQRINNGGLPF